MLLCYHQAQTTDLEHAFLPVHCEEHNAMNVVLVHYLGNESIAVTFPHGNSKSGQGYYRTCPSVLQDLSNTCSQDLPGKLILLYIVGMG